MPEPMLIRPPGRADMHSGFVLIHLYVQGRFNAVHQSIANFANGDQHGP